MERYMLYLVTQGHTCSTVNYFIAEDRKKAATFSSHRNSFRKIVPIQYFARVHIQKRQRFLFEPIQNELNIDPRCSSS